MAITVKKLKKLLEKVPDDAEIVIYMDGEYADASETDILRYEKSENTLIIGVS